MNAFCVVGEQRGLGEKWLGMEQSVEQCLAGQTKVDWKRFAIVLAGQWDLIYRKQGGHDALWSCYVSPHQFNIIKGNLLEKDLRSTV